MFFHHNIVIRRRNDNCSLKIPTTAAASFSLAAYSVVLPSLPSFYPLFSLGKHHD